MKQLKSLSTRILAGANTATILTMLAIGYSDRLHPSAHPLVANLGLLFPVFLLLNIGFLVFWLFFYKKMALLPIAGLIIGFQPVRVYTPLNIRASAPKGSIKVMSYNVYNFSTWEDPSEPSQILEYITSEHPDILCLEEFGLSGWRQEECYKTLDSLYAYNAMADSHKGGDKLGIYSRFPILRSEQIHYPSRANNSAAFYLKTGNNDTTIVIVNHFETTGLSPEDRSHFRAIIKGDMHRQAAERESRLLWHKLGMASAIRAPQADAVAEYIERHKGKSIILVGDFNDSPISYVRHRLAQELTDCYVATGNGPGISYHYNAFYVRIDNIMCSDHWMPYDCKVDNRIEASDHYPIVCWLKRRGKQ